MKILIVYDGTIDSKRSLHYGIKKAREKGGEVIVAHVFPASRFIDYDAGPRAEEFARAESAQHARDAETIIREEGEGVRVGYITEEGDPEKEIPSLAASQGADLVLASARYKGIMKAAHCPVHIMPGIILVPVDHSDTVLKDVDRIADEAAATGSKILLLGIVPVHLFSGEEKKEVEQVRKGTSAMMKKIEKALKEHGREVSEAVRSGYPDEEILKAAAEFNVSLIMLPTGGKTPSELTKAAVILLEDPDRMHMPIELLESAL